MGGEGLGISVQGREVQSDRVFCFAYGGDEDTTGIVMNTVDLCSLLSG